MQNLFAKNGSLHLPNNLCPCFCAGILLSRSFDARNAPNKPYFQWKLTDSLSNIFNSLPALFRIAEVLSQLLLPKFQLHSITAIRKLKCTNPLKKQPAVNALTKASVRKILPMPPLFAAAVLQCRSWIRILCRKRNANSAGFKTGRNAAITQSKRNATLLFEAQFAFSNSVPHFFSLPHMMFILCFWLFLRFWDQNAPNPTRFCTFAPFSGLERWHEAENNLFSTQKEKYI